MAFPIYTKEKLMEAAATSYSWSAMFKKLGARIGGNTYQRVKALARQFEIDTSHFLGNAAHTGPRHTGVARKKTPEEILVAGKKQREKSRLLRRALIESGRDHICECCGQGPTWNGQPLTLQVDHKNGNALDCTATNLRFLCPNCHTQTTNFCNQDKYKKCKTCNKKVSPNAKYCRRCVPSKTPRKVENRPSIEILLREIAELGYVGTGRKYGVSDNAVRKWLKGK